VCRRYDTHPRGPRGPVMGHTRREDAVAGLGMRRNPKNGTLRWSGRARAYNSLPNRAESAHRWKHGAYGGGSCRLRSRASGNHHTHVYWGALARVPDWAHLPCRGRPAVTSRRRGVVCGTDQNPKVPCAAPLPTLKNAKKWSVFGGPGYHGRALQDRHGVSGPARGPRPAFALAGPYTSLQT
jgi:hypothetical protein